MGFADACKRWANSIMRYDYISKMYNGLEVRHEELVQNPEGFLQTIFDFLGLDYHDGPANFAGSTLIHPLDKPTREGVHVRRILNGRPPPHEKWTSEQKEIFKATCSDAMERKGYVIPF